MGGTNPDKTPAMLKSSSGFGDVAEQWDPRVCILIHY